MSYQFRTAYEPGDVKSYNNAEYFEPGSSLTEPDQVQSIQEILARCIRDKVLPFVEKGYYDNEKVTSIDEAFATMDVTQTDGFDLADTGPILADITDNAAKAETEADGGRLETPQAFLKTDDGTPATAGTNES